MPEAIGAGEVRDALEGIPGLKLPDSFTNTKLRTIIQRKTSVVLRTRGATTLPAAGTTDRDLVDNAVLSLAVIEVKRFLRPDDSDFLRALNEELKLVMRDIQLVEDSSSDAGFRFDVVGGTDA